MLRMLIILGLFFSSLVSAETLVPAKLEDQSPKETLRKSIFGTQENNRGCRILSRDPAAAVDQDAALSATLKSIIKSIKDSDESLLVPLFHPQIKVKKASVKAAFISIDQITGPKPDATLFRAYAMNNPTGEVAGIECLEDGIKVYPLYGHPLQVGAWIQVTGKNEVARTYIILIPTKDQWRIGAWHVQQWTHFGKDIDTWRSDASLLASKKESIAAWVYLDLAGKLLDGGKFLEFPVAADLERDRAALLNGKPLIDALSPKFPGDNVVYASSLFSRKGASLLVRFKIPAEMSANAIKEHCIERFKKLNAEAWMNAIAGMRCDYVLPTESVLKEGRSGGMFVDRDIISSK